jgi:hypothetical protein
MDRSMRMAIIAGVLVLALLVAIVGSVSAQAPGSAAAAVAGQVQPL